MQLAAVFGLREARVRRLSAEYGGVPYTDFDAFLAHRPLDLVVIGSPSGLHACQGIAAAQQGLHVLVEKPLDITLARADALIEAAAASGVTLGVCLQDRFKPGVVRLKELIDAGALGRLLTLEGRMPWYRPPSYYADSHWRGTSALDGGGALMNQGIHTADLLLWMGGPVRAVQARAAALLHRIDVEDTAMAILEFESGALGTLTATTAAFPGWPRRIVVTGTEGTAILEGDSLVECVVRSGERVVDGQSGPPPPTQAAASPLVSDVGPHRAVFEDFIAAVRDRRPPRCDGREGRRSVALVLAIYDASRTGARVSLG